MARYDVGSYNPDVTIDLDRLILKHKKFGKGSRNLNKLILLAIDEGLDELARRGEEFAKSRMLTYGITGELYSNLKAERIKDGFTISTYAGNNWGFDYSMYVEFGTGLVGSGSPHPKASMEGWVYNTEHIDSLGRISSGWVYPSRPDDPNPNKWVGKDGQLYAFTKGQESRPFMYETWRYLSGTWHTTLEGYINRALKEWGDSFI